MSEHIEHAIEPVFDELSSALVLGTMPSPKSRETGFFYGNPQNRFWKVLAALFDEPVPRSIPDKQDLLLRHHIALWDVLASCDIDGASDASIRNAQPNDFSPILEKANIQAVFTTGAKATEFYRTLCKASTGLPCTALPSPSPANAQASLDDLVDAYRALLPYAGNYTAPVLDVPKVVELEQTIAANGTSLRQLMERAGRSLAYRVDKIVPAEQSICVLCGSGNNGGDGWVAARDLAEQGYTVTLITSRTPEELKAQPAHDAATEVTQALAAFERARIVTNPNPEELAVLLDEASAIIDAILGTGFSGASVRAPYDEWIKQANAQRSGGTRIVAADVPSGLSAQDGTAADPCIQADETVTMIVPKPGLMMPASASFCGTVHVAPIAYVEPILFD